MNILFSLAKALGSDPISLIMMSVMAALGAWLMRRMLDSEMSLILSFLVLLAGAVLGCDAANALGYHDAMPQGAEYPTTMVENWNIVGSRLQYMFLASTIGMCVAGLVLLAVPAIFSRSR
ncbi:MAG: hypothetical protein ACK5JT_00545 [Hyphomicrobiaceae bacterium]